MARARPCQTVLINQTPQQGMKVHSCLAVSGAGEPLGLLHQYVWSRPERAGKKEQRRKTLIAQKESYRWLQGVSAAAVGRPEGVQWVHVGD